MWKDPFSVATYLPRRHSYRFADQVPRSAPTPSRPASTSVGSHPSIPVSRAAQSCQIIVVHACQFVLSSYFYWLGGSCVPIGYAVGPRDCDVCDAGSWARLEPAAGVPCRPAAASLPSQAPTQGWVRPQRIAGPGQHVGAPLPRLRQSSGDSGEQQVGRGGGGDGLCPLHGGV